MKKIPVGATIAHAYRFAFGQFLNLLKLVWLPLLLAVGLNFLVAPQMNILMRGFETHDYSGLAFPVPVIILLLAAVWVVSFMLVTGIFQFALGKPEAAGRRWYFSVAMPLWRLLGATLLLLLVMVALTLVYVLAVAMVLFLFRLGLSVAHVSDTALKDIMALDSTLATLIGFGAFIFCWTRFGFLLGAATIAEDRIGLFRSWTLSYGNFWRMFAVSLAIMLPFMILELCVFIALGAFPHVTPGASPAQIQAAQQAANQLLAAHMQQYGIVFYPVMLLVTLILYGLMAGASVFAWRALTQETTPI